MQTENDLISCQSWLRKSILNFEIFLFQYFFCKLSVILVVLTLMVFFSVMLNRELNVQKLKN